MPQVTRFAISVEIALVVSCALVAGAVGAAAVAPDAPATTWRAAPVASVQAAAATTEATIGPPAAAPAGLPLIDYTHAAAGFPADPDPLSLEPLTEAAHPTRKIVVYDAAGGTPRAYLTPTINGVILNLPIVARRSGWVAVILPSSNRTVGWLPPEGWSSQPLRDQIVVRRSTNRLTWNRSGTTQQSWLVSLGERRTPTPLGRTFVLGRSSLPGAVYAGVDVLALGAVPDDVNAVPASLRGAHIGIHAWTDTSVIGRNVSNGCVRLPRSAQQVLLQEITPGTEVVVID